jgi:hypothetical protein
VQLAYGDDGLDPLLMEGASGGQALNMDRLMSVVRARSGLTPKRMALPTDLREAAAEVFEHAGTVSSLSVLYPLANASRCMCHDKHESSSWLWL